MGARPLHALDTSRLRPSEHLCHLTNRIAFGDFVITAVFGYSSLGEFHFLTSKLVRHSALPLAVGAPSFAMAPTKRPGPDL
jgi:hypothetical protein